ncbi:Pol II transcription elongation factor [Pseudozyma hubeiensis]|nr:Pol II transcription elongation factor [Pseudozyma hubeiensis]
MLSSTSIAVTTAALALAMASSVSSAPVNPISENYQQRRQDSQCQSLGQGPLGFNSSKIGLYSSQPPATWLEAKDGKIVATTDAPYNGTFFDFIQCSYDAPPYLGEGSVQTYQGYIKAPDGNCLAVRPLEGQYVAVVTDTCDFSGDQSYGGVDANQHFQFQLLSFDYFYSVVFLGSTAGPVNASDFGAGGNYHFGLDNTGELEVTYLADKPQTGESSEQLIAQIGSQYVSEKVMSPCTLVKSGHVELVDQGSGQTLPVYAGDSRPGHDSVFDQVLVVNGTATAASADTFSFYQCNSTYMGFEPDSNNFYGHFVSDVPARTGCYNVEYIDNIGNHGRAVTLSGTNDTSTSPNAPCGVNDGGIQLSSFFHLENENGKYVINFLGHTTADQAEQYSWTLNNEDTDASQQFLVANQTSAEYQLRFID